MWSTLLCSFAHPFSHLLLCHDTCTDIEVCVCIRAVPCGEDPQGWRGSGPNVGFYLEQRSNQAQRSRPRWTHPAGLAILHKQVQTRTHTYTHTFSEWKTFMHACMSLFDRRCDLIVEVCHPQIVKEFGPLFLSHAHFMVRGVIVLQLKVLIPTIGQGNRMWGPALWACRCHSVGVHQLVSCVLLKGGLSLCPVWCQFKPGAPSGGSQAQQDTLCTQWCIMGRPRHTEDEWQWEIKGDNVDMS